MKKVAIVTPGLLPVPAVSGGAVETLITYLIEGNEETPRFYFTVYTCGNAELDQYHYKYTKIIQIKNNRLLNFFCRTLSWTKRHCYIGMLINAYQLRLIFKNWKKYDYIMAENSLAVYELLNRLKACSGKLIYHMHNDIEDENGDKSPRRVEIAAKTSLLILTCSNYIKKQVESIYDRGAIEVLYNCVDVKMFEEKGNDSEWIRKKHNIGKNDFVVMYSGRIAEEKGVRELAMAMKRICLNNSNAKLMIVGCCWFPDIMESDYMDEVKEVIRPFQNQVIFAGYVPLNQINRYYKAASAVVIPSVVEEAFGMAALEAMVMKKPLIVTDSGGLPETVDSKCAILVNKKTDFIEKLEEAVVRLYRNQKLCKDLGEAGYQRIRSRREFQKDYYFENFVNLIRSLK